MNTWKIICATLVIFVAGIFTGAALVRFAQGGGKNWRARQAVVTNNSQPPPNTSGRPENPDRRNNPERPNQPGQQPGLLGREFIIGLDRQLHLAPEQREKIENIMNEGQGRIRDIRSKFEPDIRKEMQSVHEQIKSILTPEQREQFEHSMKQRVQQWRPDSSNGPDRRIREPRNDRNEFREPRDQQLAPPPPGGEPAPQNP